MFDQMFDLVQILSNTVKQGTQMGKFLVTKQGYLWEWDCVALCLIAKHFLIEQGSGSMWNKEREKRLGSYQFFKRTPQEEAIKLWKLWMLVWK